MKNWLLALSAASVVFVGCQQTPAPAKPAPSPEGSNGYRLIGTLEVNFGNEETTTARFTPIGLRPQGALLTETDLEFNRTTFQAVNGGTPPSTFLNAGFEVKNKRGSTVNNLTIVAYHKTGNESDTAFKNVANFNSVNIPNYARAIKPCHSTNNGTTLSSGNEDLMLFAEHELGVLTTTAGSELAGGEYLFPYGYVARDISNANSRAIASDTNSFTGKVSLCVRTDGSNNPIGSAYRFSLTALVFENPTETTRVAESLEEQPSSGATVRAGAIGASQISALFTSNLLTLTNGNRVNACRVRTAGSAVTPLATLEPQPLITTAGSLDDCFAADGKRVTAFSGTLNSVGKDVAVDSKGRVVVAGYTTIGTTGSFAVARFNSDGSLDTSFGSGGQQTIGFASSALAEAVAVDAQDRIIVVGNVGADFAIARLDATGALDTNFNGAGKTTVAFSGFSAYARGVAVDSSNRVVVVGYITDGNSDEDFGLARLNVDGTLDTGFGTAGRRTVDFGGNSDFGNDVKLDSTGKIIVVGDSSGATTDFAVARLDANGVTLDTTFNTNGQLLIDFGATDIANAVAVTSSGALAVAGTSQVGSNLEFGVARITASGALDTSFDGDGVRRIGGFSGVDAIAHAVAVDSSDRVIVTGTSATTFAAGGVAFAGGDFAAVRFLPSGAVDPSFNTTGRLNIDFGGANDDGFGGVLSPGGQLLIGGSYSSIGFGVTRVNL
jgi:uncharacterized delta-60 repeat protein